MKVLVRATSPILGFIRDLRLSTKVFLLVGLSILVGALTTAFLFYRINTTSAAYQSIITSEMHKQDLARVMQVNFKKAVQSWYNILLQSKDEESFANLQEEYHQEMVHVDEALTSLKGAISDPNVVTLLEAFESEYDVLRTTYDEALKQFQSSRRSSVTQAVDMAAGLDRSPTDLIDEIVDQMREQNQKAIDTLKQSVVRERTIVGISLAAIFVALIVALTLLIRTLARRMAVVVERLDSVCRQDIAGLESGIQAIARGDLSQKVEIRTAQVEEDAKDELGMVGRNVNDILQRIEATLSAFGHMRTTLEELVRQTNSLTEAARSGSLDRRGQVDKFGGVYRKLIEGVNDTLDAMVAPIDETAEVLQRVADRDVTARMSGNYRGDFARIQEALNLAVENLDDALAQVTVTAEQVSAASNQISSGSHSLADGSSRQASSLEEISSSLQEVTSMAGQNADKAKEARELSEKARTSADKGVASIGRLSASIDKIKASADKTGRIVKTIDEIAFRGRSPESGDPQRGGHPDDGISHRRSLRQCQRRSFDQPGSARKLQRDRHTDTPREPGRGRYHRGFVAAELGHRTGQQRSPRHEWRDAAGGRQCAGVCEFGRRDAPTRTGSDGDGRCLHSQCRQQGRYPQAAR